MALKDKHIKSTIIQRHDTAANWAKATNFVPRKGEVIIYDSDYDAEKATGSKYPRIKVGDGVLNSETNKIVGTNVDKLPFLETAYTNNTPLLNDIGGIKASEHKNGFNNIPVTDLLTELLYPYTPPVIEVFILDPTAGVNEKNVELPVKTATAKVLKKSKPITAISLYKGSTLLETKDVTDDEITSDGATFTFNIDETLDGEADSVSYKVKVTEAGDNGSTIESNAQTYSFVYPYFYGVIENGVTPTSAIISSFTKSVRAKGAHSHEYTTNNTCPVIAYPKSYGPLKSIVDPNNFTQDWTLHIVPVDNGTTIIDVDYYVYVGGAATLTASYKFNH